MGSLAGSLENTGTPEGASLASSGFGP